MWFKRGLSESDDRWKENLNYTLGFLLAWLAGGSLVLVFCTLTFFVQNPTRAGYASGLNVFCHGALLSFSFGAFGGFIGFLFGIPRQSRQSDGNATKTAEN